MKNLSANYFMSGTSFLAFLLVPLSAFAQTWDAGGGANTNWDHLDNWVGDTLPDPTDTVTFGTDGSGANLNGARTVDTLILNRSADFTISDSTNSESGLTITSGNLTFGDGSTNSGRRAYINSNLTLGADGIWNSSGYFSYVQPGLTVNGSIRGDYGITLNAGIKFLLLAGDNTFTGGFTLNGWGNTAVLGLGHTGALGTGNLIVSGTGPGGSGKVYFGTNDSGIAAFNNSIHFDASTNGVISFDTNYGASAGTQIKSLTGDATADTVQFWAGSRTWRFDEGISLTGGTLIFRNESATGVGTFEVGGAGGARAILVQNYTPSMHGSNLLFTASGTQSGTLTFIEAATPLSGHTVGITHAGNTTLSGQQQITSAASGVNYMALDSASRLNVSGLVTDGASAQGLRINDNFVVNVAGTQTTSGTNTPTGTVELSRALGNTYDGTTTIHAGTLLISNTANSATGTGAVEVRDGATLGGTGIIVPTGTNGVTVKSGGVIAPGDGGIGILTLDGSNTSGTMATFELEASFRFDLNASTVTSDRIALIGGALGDLAFQDNTINFNILAGTLVDGQEYTLFSGTNPNQFAGLTTDGDGYITAGLSIGTGLTGAFATHSQLRVFDNNIILIAVPEPGVFSLLGAAGCAMLLFGRRKRLA